MTVPHTIRSLKWRTLESQCMDADRALRRARRLLFVFIEEKNLEPKKQVRVWSALLAASHLGIAASEGPAVLKMPSQSGFSPFQGQGKGLGKAGELGNRSDTCHTGCGGGEGRRNRLGIKM